MTGKIIINCPAMPILATWNPLIRECQELYCPNCEIIFDNGEILPFYITFPKAKVRLKGFGNWLVDEVPAKGWIPKECRELNSNIGSIIVTMEKERVLRTSWRSMDAQPCIGRGEAYFQNKKWKVIVNFPKCTATASGTGLFKYIAEPVIAEGVIYES